MRKISRRLALCSGLLALTGCSSLFGSSKTRLKATVDASGNVNPGPDDRPAPVAVRFYELTTRDSFDAADFQGLFYNPSTALGAALLNTISKDLIPGTNETMERDLSDQTRFLGIVAGYRDITNATWRTVVTVDQGDSNTVKVTLDRLSLTATRDDSWF
ncbi:type VI secretion system lipoprotein TssJ [Inquilinus sp. CA228]|uniref:type VI secretion system lipoprotein TssJ n=1 Tax=Inquilinus sp. CA228 TaxID=3455609 RepID=UPI003F8D3BE9